MTVNLFEITQEINALEQMLMDDGGEIGEVSEELASYVQELLTQKTDNMVGFIDKMESEIALAQKQIKRIGEYKKSRENAIERLKAYCLFCMDRLNTDKVIGTMSSIKRSAPVKSVNIIDADKLPFDLVETKATPRKAEIAKLLKAGEAVPGAELKTGNPSVRFSMKKVGE